MPTDVDDNESKASSSAANYNGANNNGVSNLHLDSIANRGTNVREYPVLSKPANRSDAEKLKKSSFSDNNINNRNNNRSTINDMGLEMINGDYDSPDQRRDEGTRFDCSIVETINNAAGPDERLVHNNPPQDDLPLEKVKRSFSSPASGGTNTTATSLPGARPTAGSLLTKTNMAHVSTYYTTANTAANNTNNSTAAPVNPASASLTSSPQMVISENSIENQLSANQTNAIPSALSTVPEESSQSNPDPSLHVILEATLIEEPIQATVAEPGHHFYDYNDEEEEGYINEDDYFGDQGSSNNNNLAGNQRRRSETRPWYKTKEFAGVSLLLTMAVTLAIFLTLVISNNTSNVIVSESDSTTSTTTPTTNNTSSGVGTTVLENDANAANDGMIMINTPSSAPTIPPTTQKSNNDSIANDGTADNLSEDLLNNNNNLFSNEEQKEEECTSTKVKLAKKLLSNEGDEINNEFFCSSCYGAVAMDGENAMIEARGKLYFFHLVPTNANKESNASFRYEWQILSILEIENYPGFSFPSMSGNLVAVGAPDEVVYSNEIHGGGASISTAVRSGAVYIFELLPENTNVDVDGGADEVGGGSSGNKKIWRQTGKLIPNDPMTGAEFGHSVSILSNIVVPSSSDENVTYSDVIAVGAPQDREEGIGSAYVFRRLRHSSDLVNDVSRGEWFQDAKFAPNDPNLSDFAWDVEVFQQVDYGDVPLDNDQGNTSRATNLTLSMTTVVAVGDDWYGEGNPGTVFLYRYDEYDGADAAPNKGNKDDGIIMNSSTNDTNGGIWSQWGFNIMNFGCDADFGASIVFNDFDQSLAIGCFADDNGIGSVYYYSYNSNFADENGNDTGDEIYSFQQKISPSDGVPGDSFSNYGHIDLHGNLMVVGSASANDRRGKAYAFVRQIDEGSGKWFWKEVEILKPLEGEEEEIFGETIAVHGNQIILNGANNVYSYEVDICE